MYVIKGHFRLKEIDRVCSILGGGSGKKGMRLVATATSAAATASFFFAATAAATTTIATTATAIAATFRGVHIEYTLDFLFGSFASRYNNTLVVKFLTSEHVVDVDNNSVFLHIAHETVEVVTIFVDEGNHIAGIDVIASKSTIDIEVFLGNFYHAALFVRAVGFVYAKCEVESVAFVEVANVSFEAFERHSEVRDELEGISSGSLFDNFVDAFSIVGKKFVCYSNVAVGKL